MSPESTLAALFELARPSCGAFRGRAAVEAGVSRAQLQRLVEAGVARRVLPDTYVLTAAAPSHGQRLHAALLWAGDRAGGDGRSAGAVYGMEGVVGGKPEIALLHQTRLRSSEVVIRRTTDLRSLMLRTVNGVRVTGPEATLIRLAAVLDAEALEVACEDARRRRLTSIPALESYLGRFGACGRPGIAAMRSLLRELDPAHPARSKLEVKTRRLLVAHGLAGFEREYPLEWNGRPYAFDFAFVVQRTILETNGRRFHDDPRDYEYDNEKWSVPGRHGFKLVLATWEKVTKRPKDLLAELRTTLAA